MHAARLASNNHDVDRAVERYFQEALAIGQKLAPGSLEEAQTFDDLSTLEGVVREGNHCVARPLKLRS